MITITGWNETFENADTRKRQRLKSFHCPSGCESRGLVNLLCSSPDQRAALMAFGVFQLLCQLSATLPADARGRLIHSDGRPMTVEYLSRLLRVDICHLSASLEILQREDVGWISGHGENGHLPTICQLSPGFVQGEGEGEGEVEGEVEGEGEASAPSGRSPAESGSKSPAPSRLSWSKEGGFEGITEADRKVWAKAYPLVNVESSLAAMHAWLRANPSKASSYRKWERFVAGWLSRDNGRLAERHSADSASAGKPKMKLIL